MSFGIPISYAELQNNLAIPSAMVGDDLKMFKGARSNIRQVPTSSGNVGPSGMQLFNVPTGSFDYIKSNSMYYNCTVTISGTHAANTNQGSLSFDGYSSQLSGHIGGASSLISRINCMIGGTSLSYPSYNHMRNSILPHVCGSEFIAKDLRELEFAGVQFNTGTTSGTAFSYVLNVSIPLFIPVFSSSQAFPALLVQSPITIEILTESVADAFRSVENATLTYQISNASLVYETITVSSEFKQALLQSKAGQLYNIKLNDWMAVGPTASDPTLNYQIGVGLSSLRAVCWTEFLNNAYTFNGLNDYKVFVDNLQISVNNPRNSSITYAELNRALSKLNDYNVTSALVNVNASATLGNTTSLRSDYVLHKFVGAASCDVFSDYGYASTGINASTVTLNLVHTPSGGTSDVDLWQSSNAHNTAAKLYVFLLHDSTLSVDVSSGVVMVRK